MTLQFLPSREPAKIYTGKEAIKRLTELGISFEDIEQAVQGALIDYNNLSEYAYSLHKNLHFFFQLIIHFRSIVVKRGWSYDDSLNVNKTIEPGNKFAIIFSSGDKNVCNPNLTPYSKNKKGEVSYAIIEMNKYVQMTFIDKLGFPPCQEKYDIGKMPHRFFIFRKNKNKVRIELSLAREFDKKTHKICSWSERIILPEINYNEPVTILNNANNNPPKPKNMCYDKEKELGITRKQRK